MLQQNPNLLNEPKRSVAKDSPAVATITRRGLLWRLDAKRSGVKQFDMSLLDELNAATQSLDRLLSKLSTAQPSEKERLEAAVITMQAKVQQIQLAIQSIH